MLPDRIVRKQLPSSPNCFACGKHNPRGLQLRFWREPDPDHGERVATRCSLPADLNGFSDRTHGGIVATLLDEAMGWAAVARSGRFGYTVELKVRYPRGVPTEQELELRGYIQRVTRRLLFAGADIRDPQAGDRPDAILATAEGKFMLASEEESRQIDQAMLYEPGMTRVVDR